LDQAQATGESPAAHEEKIEAMPAEKVKRKKKSVAVTGRERKDITFY